jgi:multicomponent Na+:H+ antiporter subunit E
MKKLSLISRIGAGFELAIFYLGQVLLSNFRVAADILIPNNDIRPGVFHIDVAGYSPAEVVLAANLISMTPGTLALDYDESTHQLSIHSLYMTDPDVMQQSIQSQWLSRVARVFGNPIPLQRDSAS